MLERVSGLGGKVQNDMDVMSGSLVEVTICKAEVGCSWRVKLL